MNENDQSQQGGGVITLDREQLAYYIHQGVIKREELTSTEDHICTQLGLFFAANLHLADYAIDIQRLTLTPRGDDETPLSTVRIHRRGRDYRITSDGDGNITIPWRKPKRRPRRPSQWN